jgi:hypothetical protein
MGIHVDRCLVPDHREEAEDVPPQFPWYRKEVPAFSDMLAALRRETWGRRLLDPAGFDRSDQKSVGPLLDAIGYAA